MRPNPTALLLLLFALPISCTACTTDPAASAPKTLSILTYNVLASQHHDDQRYPAIFAILEQSHADILCLQEVLPNFLDQLRREPWFAERYYQPKLDGLDVLPNGNYICARHELSTDTTRAEIIRHDGPQGRESLIVHLNVADRPLAIATCHLESLLDDGPIRAKQLDDVFERMPANGDAIFAGDFNFGDGEQPDSQHLKPEFVDAWQALHPEDPGYTWDIEHSDMAARGSFVDEPSRRIDRILVRSTHWQPHRITMVGNDPIDADGMLFPSDHFGLLATCIPR